VNERLAPPRLVILAACALSAPTTVLAAWSFLSDYLWLYGGVLAVWLLVVGLAGGLGGWAVIRAGRPAARARRPRRLVVHEGAFVAPWLAERVHNTLIMILVVPVMAALPMAWLHDFDPERATDWPLFLLEFAAVLALTALLFARAYFSWRRPFDLCLTPEGILWRDELLHRFIPWPALALGGPSHPRPDEKDLRLVVARPELVTRPGFQLVAMGPIRYPHINLMVDVRPDFLADAIRWYVEHPEDRAAIGTVAEHDRLVAVLTASGPAAASTTVVANP
jgi:hypothetical protein